MRLLVTRPAADAAELATILAARGHVVHCDPLLDIRPRQGADFSLENVEALLFTSANGVRAFCAVQSMRDLPVYAVGDRTAYQARQAGFGGVRSAGGDVKSLVQLIAASRPSTGGTLLHITGTATTGDLVGQLRGLGHRVASAALYEACPATALTTETCDGLRTGQWDGVLLFSPRTARNWMKLLDESGLLSAVRRLDAWCLSEAVAVELASGEYRSVRIAAHPTQASLLAALDRVARDKETT